MIGIFFFSIVFISFLMALSLGVYVLFRIKSDKKNYFLLNQIAAVTYLFGFLFLITSATNEAALNSMKVMATGAYFVPVFTFFFVADYCRVKLHRVFVRTSMLAVSVVMLLIMWTSKSHNLLYLDFHVDPVKYLVIIPGPLFLWFQAYPMLCLFISIIMLLYHLKKWKGQYRKQLLILILVIGIPAYSEALYYILMVTKGISLYSTPVFLAITGFILYLGVLRYNIFEIISTATFAAMEYIAEGFVLLDERNNYLTSNPTAAKIFPGINKLNQGESVFSLEKWPNELKNAGNGTVQFSINGEGINYFEASISSFATKNKTSQARIYLFKNITESVNFMKQLENAAYTDPLTGIYNRKHFFELAQIEIERAHRTDQNIYAAVLDLDFFKKVNDTYGHTAGDQVLKTAAGIFQRTIRSYDLLCRYGGEEFAILLTNMGIQETMGLMERVRENIENCLLNYEGQEIKISCSIGVAQFREDDTLESAIKKADEALYAAKNAGRNQVRVYEKS